MWLVALLAATACVPEAVPPPTPPPPQEPAPPAPVAAAPAPEMKVGGQLGSIEPQAVEGAFTAVSGELQKCHVARLGRLRWLGGTVKVVVRIGEDGRARHAYLEDSTLGDRESEACMLRALAGASWPHPVGGDADVKNSFELLPPPRASTPRPWTEDMIAPQLAEHRTRLRACTASTKGVFRATAYVVRGAPSAPAKSGPAAAHPKKKRKPSGPRPRSSGPVLGGHIAAVGIATGSPEGLAAVECLEGVLLEMKLPTPPAPAAKVSFTL